MSTPIKLSSRQVAWVTENGPWPFTVRCGGLVEWPERSDTLLLDEFAGKPGVPAMIGGLLSAERAKARRKS